VLKEARKPIRPFSEEQFMSLPGFPAELRRQTLIVSVAVLYALFVFINPGSNVRAQNSQTRLLRTPTVSATQIAFAYAQNIWTVPRGGGSARRITSFQGQTSAQRVWCGPMRSVP
jgi:hypothetical protein